MPPIKQIPYLLLALILLISCQNQPSPAISPFPTPTKPILFPQNQVSPTPDMPAFSPSPTPPPIPTLSPHNYRLRPPPLDTLIDLYLSHVPKLISETLPFPWQQPITYPDYDENRWIYLGLDNTLTYDLLEQIDHDLDRFYEGEIAGTRRYITHYDSNPVKLSSKLFRSGLVDLVNVYDLQFEPNKTYQLKNIIEVAPLVTITITSHPVQLDQDIESEWLLEINIPALITDFIPIDINEEGNYYQLPNELTIRFSRYGGCLQLESTQDLNGDSFPELILSCDGEVGQGSFRVLFVFTWKNGKFAQVSEIQLSKSNFANIELTHEIGDFNEDGLLEIKTHQQQLQDIKIMGCYWEQETLYYWVGDTLQYTSTNHITPSITAYCDMYPLLQNPNLYPTSERIRTMENALATLQKTSDVPPDYLALVYTYLSMAYAGIHQDTTAHQTLSKIFTLPTTHFTKLIQTEYQANAGNLITFCHAIFSRTFDFFHDPIQLELPNYRSGFYPLCPFPTLIEDRLNNIDKPINQTPQDILQTVGFTSSYNDTLNIDEDEDLEVLALLDFPSSPTYLIFDPSDEQWQIHYIHRTTPFINSTEIITREIDNDNIPEIILVDIPDGEYSIIQCRNQADQEVTASFVLSLVIKENNQYQLAPEKRICDPNFDLNTITMDTLQIVYEYEDYGEPDWLYLKDFEKAKSISITSYLSELQQAVHAQTNPHQTQTDIEALIAYLPPNDSNAQLILNQLLFLKALNHELQNQETQAITTYLTLIQTAPASHWSWLAWARLQPIISPIP